MKYLQIVSQWAGHCKNEKSDKVWAACLAREEEEGDPSVTSSTLTDMTPVVFVRGHGKNGAALIQSEPRQLTWKAAQFVFKEEQKKKMGKGYASVSFAPYVAKLGRPLGLPLVLPSSPAASGAPAAPTPAPQPTPVAQPATPLRHTAALLKPMAREQLLALLADEGEGHPSSYGLSEKANGHRCFIDYDGSILRAYNRKGDLVSAPPEQAQALCRLGHPFVIDGERLLGEQAGWFAAFDVLEWKGERLLHMPYRDRMTRLVRGMRAAGLLHSERITPLLRQAWENSTVPGLGVLLAVQGAARAGAVLTEVEATGLEGVVLRHLSAPYAEAGFKYKVLAEVDAFVIGMVPGVSAGSLTLAMVRAEDRAIIEVGHVRSGLNDAEVRAVQTLVEQARQGKGTYPVFRVSYLPASTNGLSLVQPKTSMECLRDDKTPQECTTGQLGSAKAFLVKLAKPVKGVKLFSLASA